MNYLKIEHLVKNRFKKYVFTRADKSLLLCQVWQFKVYVDMNSMIVYVQLPYTEMNRNYYKNKARAYKLKEKVNRYLRRIIKNKYL